ncbi:MAG: hypothetical protein AAF802_01485 [Planctomycetota bacterium]
MLGILFALAIVWFFVTLIGHATWVVFAAFCRTVFGLEGRSDSRERSLSDSALIDAMLATAIELKDRGLLDRELSGSISDAIAGARRKAATNQQERHASAPSPIPLVPLDRKQNSKNAATSAQRAQKLSSSVTTKAAVIESQSRTSVRRATDVPDADSKRASSAARRSLAEFLADHNIRWGELIAGVLIIVCSIGLVVSLWSTLTTMHRVIPSLVFLLGNAAIFGAGFYTLFRWRLRETSRATLVIALLLVPLSILSGISVTGIEQDSVPLDDPITLLVLAISACVYALLCWNAARALAGKRIALPLSFGFLSTVFLAPLLPAATRWLGDDSVLFVAIASISVTASLYGLQRIKRRPCQPHASRCGLAIGVMAAGLSVVTAYVAYAILEPSLGAFFVLAALVLPAFLQIARTTYSIGRANDRNIMATIGLSAMCFVMLVGTLLVIPSLAHASWFFGWTASMLACGMVMATESHLRKVGLLTITVNVALSVFATASIATHGLSWTELSVLQRFVGGGPMLITMLLGLSANGFAIAVRGNSASRTAMSLGYVCWLIAGVHGLAAMFFPTELLGAINGWVHAFAIGVAGAALFFHLNLMPRWDYRRGSTVTITLFAYGLMIACWTLIIRDSTRQSDWAMAYGNIMIGLVVTFVSGFNAGIVCELSRLNRVIRRTLARAMSATGGVLLALSLVAVANAAGNGRLIVASAFAAALLWTWSSSLGHHASRVLSKIGWTVSLVLSGYLLLPDRLFAVEAFRSGDGFWNWSLLLWSLVFFLRFEEMIAAKARPWQRRSLLFRRLVKLHVTRPSAAGSPAWISQSCHRPATALALSGTLATSFVGYGRAVFGYEWTPIIGAQSFVVPIVTFLITYFYGRKSRRLREVLGVSFLLWAGDVVAVSLWSEPELRLQFMTSALVLVAFLNQVRRKRFVPSLMKTSFQQWLRSEVWVSSALSVTAISIASLLISSWYPSVELGFSPALLPTISVSVWITWAIVILTLRGVHSRDELACALSASLVAPLSAMFASVLIPGQTAAWILWSGVALGTFVLLLDSVQRERDSGESWSNTPRWYSLISMTVAFAAMIVVTLEVVSGRVFLNLGDLLPAIVLTITTLVLQLRFWSDSSNSRFERFGSSGYVLLLASGQFSLLLSLWIPQAQPYEWVRFLWIASSMWIFALNRRELDRWIGLAVVTVVGIWAGVESGWGSAMSSTGISASVALLIAPLLSAPIIRIRHKGDLCVQPRSFAQASIGAGLLGGVYFVASSTSAFGQSSVALCLLAWAVFWQYSLGFASSIQPNARRFFNCEADLLALILGLYELGRLLTDASESMSEFWLLRVVLVAVASCYWLVASLGTLRRESGCLPYSLSNAITCASLMVVHLGCAWGDLDVASRTVLAMAGGVAGLAMFVFNWPTLQKVLPVLSISEVDWRSIRLVTILLGSLVCFATLYLVAFENDHPWTPLSICTAGIVAMIFGELGQRRGMDSARIVSLWIGLLCIGLVCSLHAKSQAFPLWHFSATWLIGWTVTLVLLGFFPARVLTRRVYDAWRPAIRSGFVGACVIAVCTLTAIFVIEIWIRVAGLADSLDRTVVLAVATILLGLTIATTAAAILSGPGRSLQKNWNLTPSARRWLIIAAQVSGGLTWFHLFLCKSPLASLGLRPFWPYVVMMLAFSSVGVSEWARRTRDHVLHTMIQRTAFLLPLIPVLGFWLSGSWITSMFGESSAGPWDFIGGRVTYQALLAVATLYYGVAALIWRSSLGRIISIVLANLLVWVVLAQMPGWTFVTHPQAWLIPAAISVLFATHFHRQILGDKAVSVLRYACTITIYLSSTADMMLQGIGESLAGPMILVAIACAGAAVGVAFRIRSFLYLGSFFVFIGTASMVWHAQVQIGAVWPWWVFGITSGVLLMGALTFLEKNRPQIRRYLEATH